MGDKASRSCCGCEASLWHFNPDIYVPVDYQCLASTRVRGTRSVREVLRFFEYQNGTLVSSSIQPATEIQRDSLDLDREELGTFATWGRYRYADAAPYMLSETFFRFHEIQGDQSSGTYRRVDRKTETWQQYTEITIDYRLSARFDVSNFFYFDRSDPDAIQIDSAGLLPFSSFFRPSTISQAAEDARRNFPITTTGQYHVALSQSTHPSDTASFDDWFSMDGTFLNTAIPRSVLPQMPTSDTGVFVMLFRGDQDNSGGTFTQLELQLRIDTGNYANTFAVVDTLPAKASWQDGFSRQKQGEDVQYISHGTLPFRDSRHVLDCENLVINNTTEPFAVDWTFFIPATDDADEDVKLRIQLDPIANFSTVDKPDWLPVRDGRVPAGETDIRQSVFEQKFAPQTFSGSPPEPDPLVSETIEDLSGFYHVYRLRVNGLGIDVDRHCLALSDHQPAMMVHVYDDCVCVEPFVGRGRRRGLISTASFVDDFGQVTESYRDGFNFDEEVLVGRLGSGAAGALQNWTPKWTPLLHRVRFTSQTVITTTVKMVAFVMFGFPDSPFGNGARLGKTTSLLFDRITKKIWHHAMTEENTEPDQTPARIHTRFTVRGPHQKPTLYAFTRTASLASTGVDRVPYDEDSVNQTGRSQCPLPILGSALYSHEKRTPWNASVTFGDRGTAEMKLIAYNPNAQWQPLPHNRIEHLVGSTYISGIAEFSQASFDRVNKLGLGDVTLTFDASSGELVSHASARFNALDDDALTGIEFDLDVHCEPKEDSRDLAITIALTVGYVDPHFRWTQGLPLGTAPSITAQFNLDASQYSIPRRVIIYGQSASGAVDSTRRQTATLVFRKTVTRESIGDGEEIVLLGAEADNIDALEAEGLHGLRIIDGVHDVVDVSDRPINLQRQFNVLFTTSDTLLRDLHLTITPEPMAVDP